MKIIPPTTDRSCADDVGEVRCSIEESLDAARALVRRDGHPELLERDREMQAELDLTCFRCPVERSPEVVLFG